VNTSVDRIEKLSCQLLYFFIYFEDSKPARFLDKCDYLLDMVNGSDSNILKEKSHNFKCFTNCGTSRKLTLPAVLELKRFFRADLTVGPSTLQKV
jgi:hypothetical protein